MKPVKPRRQLKPGSGTAAWYPRVCTGCGERILISKPTGGVRFDYDHRTGVASAWHSACDRKRWAK